MVNREGLRFYDEGEDFWPKRYAIWGRLVAMQPGQVGYCIIDSKGPSAASCRRCFPVRRPHTLPALARQLQRARAAFMPKRWMPSAFACLAATSTTRCWTTASPRRRAAAQDSIGRDPISTPPCGWHGGYGASPSPISACEPTRTPQCISMAGPATTSSSRGEMMAGNVLGKGYTAGVGMSIGTAFGRLAGSNTRRRGRTEGGAACSSLSRSPAKPRPWPTARWHRHEAELSRQLQICNACRYCEGFCAVFPAMTRRLEFAKADIHYLANLCHNCGACFQACQYAPPHEFALNFPQAMAQVRAVTYTGVRLWPAVFRRAVSQGGCDDRCWRSLPGSRSSWCPAMAMAAPVLHQPHGGQLLRRVSAQLPGLGVRARVHDLPCSRSGSARAGSRGEVAPAVDLPRGQGRCWPPRAGSGGRRSGARRRAPEVPRWRPRRRHRSNEDDRYTQARRRFHHLTFYGFLLCFAATCVATLYHFVLRQEARHAPSPACPWCWAAWVASACCSGPAGLLWLRPAARPAPRATWRQRPHGPRLPSPCCWRPAPPASRCCCCATRALDGPGPGRASRGCLALFLTLPYGKIRPCRSPQRGGRSSTPSKNGCPAGCSSARTDGDTPSIHSNKETP